MKKKNENVLNEIYVENEIQANKATAIAMIVLYLALIVEVILTFLNVVYYGKVAQSILLGICTGTLLIPAIIGLILKGKKKWIKWMLLTTLAISVAAAKSLILIDIGILMIIPLVLAARYYSRRVNFIILILTIGLFIGSLYVKAYSDYNFLYFNEFKAATDYDEAEIEAEKEALMEESNEETETIEDEEVYSDEEVGLSFFAILPYQIIPTVITYLLITLGCSQIARSGNSMIKKQGKLSEEKARTESELSIAKNIQKNILPSNFPMFPDHKEFDIFASMTAAKEVGGDFYDIFLIDENHLAVVIADVSGKGVPGALIMMTAKTLIKNTAQNGYAVDEIFNIVNKQLCERNSLSHFITSWFGIIDLKTGKLEFVNAGHNQPLIYSQKENQFNFLKTKPNLFLAGFDTTKYTKQEETLKPGDKLFLYTDGVTEATNETDELYGEERLQKYLNSHIEDNPEDTLNGIKADIDMFVGNREQSDDITMLEFLFKGKNGK